MSWVMPGTTELEAANRVDARLREGVDDLLQVVRHDLGLEDEDVVWVVDPEAVRDVFGARAELDGTARDERVGAWIAQANCTPVT